MGPNGGQSLTRRSFATKVGPAATTTTAIKGPTGVALAIRNLMTPLLYICHLRKMTRMKKSIIIATIQCLKYLELYFR